MPTLADIYSAINTAKRKGADFVQNPGTSLQQMLGNANDRARALNEQDRAATDEFLATRKLNGPLQMQSAMDLAGAYNPAGMTVWHGSPYKFTQFDASKIGSGEGAQAFGHGLYVAENPKVAKEYQEKLSSTSGAKRLLGNASGDINAAITEAERKVAHYKDIIANGGGGMISKAKHFLQMSQKNLDDLMATKQGLPENKGALYKIDLPDEHIEKMIDWDKPLSDQSKSVKEALSSLPHRGPTWSFKDTLETLEAAPHLKNDTSLNPTGSQIYSMFGQGSMVGNSAQGQAEASKTLANLGIPGIKYLDEGSRDLNKNWVVNIKDYGGYDFPSLKEAQAFMKSNPQYDMSLTEPKKATSNFVIFPGKEHLLDIQDINGSPLK